MKSKHFLIVGGTSGIGKSVTEQLLTNGHQVTVLSRGKTTAEFNHGSPAILLADVTNRETPLPEIYDPIDGIVYSPGSINLKPFKMLKEDDFILDFNVNLLGAVRVIKNYLPLLLKSEDASIVLFSSVAAQTGLAFHTSIAASKGAIEGFARSLAAELSPSVRVNVVAPSITNTPLASRLLNTEEKIKSSAERHPLKRIGEPEDIASLVVFLLSTQSRWITGQVMHADGGLSKIKI